MVRTSIGHTTPLIAPSTDSFGCPFDMLYKNQSIRGADIGFFRKGSRDSKLEQVTTSASDRGFVIGVSTSAGHTRRIFHEHHATGHDFDENSIYVRDLSEPYKADLGGAMDFLLLEISPASLNRIAEESDVSGVTSLSAETASTDIVLANLTRALIPSLENPQEASTLFVDQLATVIGTHVVRRYGGRSSKTTTRSRKLSRSHETLAKTLLRERLSGDISILDVARACNLSRGYFTHAFRETTGMTPYRWLLGERVALAQNLLRGSQGSLSEIAITCGFADQSHFTRVFTSLVGTAPGNWRRNS